jgi:hypothetical protein
MADIMPKQRERILAKLDLHGGFRLREQTNERKRRIAMLMTSLPLATVTAVFVVWIANPASAQSVHATAPLAAQAPLAATPQLALHESPRKLVPEAQATAPLPALTGVYRVSGTNPNGSGYRGMVSLALSGEEYEFKWWIGRRQALNGIGRFVGRMLVVDWGATNPVMIYTLGNHGRLDGEWADGRAMETLDVFARAAQDAVPRLDGRYQVTGRNPNGSTSSGTVTIINEGSRYRLNWSIGSRGYRGIGTLNDNLLTVDCGCGSATPVVYAVSADGRLRGLWAGGSAEEILTPQASD